MGFLKQLSKDLKRQAKATESQKAKGDTDTTIQGEAPPPVIGEPLVITLKAGSDICLDIEVDSSEEADRSLLGRPNDDDYVERSVRVRIRRDLEQVDSSRVLVETRKGEPVGVISGHQSYYACELINQVGEAVAAQNPSLVGRAPHLDVSCRVEGEWEQFEWDDEPAEWEANIDLAEIRVKAPVDITEIGE